MVNSFQNINTNPRSMMAGTSVVLNIYLLTIGSMILGFSLYVGLETLERTTRKYVNWTGEGMLWLFVLLFISIFILFIPSDLLKLKYQIKIETFIKDLEDPDDMVRETLEFQGIRTNKELREQYKKRKDEAKS